MAQRRFSVVIPTHNRAHLIDHVLQSVFAQDFGDFDVVVVDDGSTDGTREILRRYGSRLCYHWQQNAGPGTARNTGAALASGQYIAFLDSDDLWLPWTLETFDNAIRQAEEPALLLGTQHNFRRESDLLNITRGAERFMRFDDYFQSVGVHQFFAATGNLVVKRSEFAKTSGFPINLRCSEDAHFMLLNGRLPGFCGILSPYTYGLRRSEEPRVTNEAKGILDGALYLCRQERLGAYPGGDQLRDRRLKFICDLASDSSLSCISHGVFAGSYKVYGNIWWWQLQRRQYSYVPGVPLQRMHVIAAQGPWQDLDDRACLSQGNPLEDVLGNP